MVKALSWFFAGLAGLSLVQGSMFSSQPELEATAEFPDNPLNQIFNGQNNQVMVNLANQAKSDLTIDFVSGAFREVGGKEKLIRNTTALKYSLLLPSSATTQGAVDEDGQPKKIQVPYQFYSEFRTGDIGLTLWVDYSDADNNKFRTTAFDDVVTVIEPPQSWLDPQLIFLYLLLASSSAYAVYFVYTTFFATKKGKKSKRSKGSSAKSTAITSVPQATSEGEKENEWIPEHHLRARKASQTGSGASTPRRKGKGGGLTSASETEGGASSGGEAGPRRRKR